MTYKTTITGLKKYLDCTIDLILLLISTHEKQKKNYSISKESNKFTKQFDLALKEMIKQLKQLTT